jgi:hypothetical protein
VLFAAFHPLNARRNRSDLEWSPLKTGGGAPNRAPPSPISISCPVVVVGPNDIVGARVCVVERCVGCIVGWVTACAIAASIPVGPSGVRGWLLLVLATCLSPSLRKCSTGEGFCTGLGGCG